MTPTLVDPTLKHQLELRWASDGKQETLGRCNCGWFGLRRRPEVDGSVQATLAEYERHLVDG